MNLRPALRTFAIVAALSTAGSLLAHSARAGTLVQFDFGSRGVVLVDLFDTVAPNCVDAFLGYVTSGHYTDTAIHRSLEPASGLGIVQGGGYDDQLNSITQVTSFSNEYRIRNRRGTLGSARPIDPTQFTSQWYFNTTNNTQTLNEQNSGGYAVFGWVVGGGMSTIDSVNAIANFNYRSDLRDLPLENYSEADLINGVSPLDHLVVLNGVSVVKTHPSFQNPLNPLDVNNDGAVTELDQLIIQDQLFLIGGSFPAESFVGSTYLYLDTNGDGVVTERDMLIPEPSTMLLGTLGLCGVIAVRRRVRHQWARAR